MGETDTYPYPSDENYDPTKRQMALTVAQYREIIAERDRYRKALRAIAGHDEAPGVALYAMHVLGGA